MRQGQETRPPRWVLTTASSDGFGLVLVGVVAVALVMSTPGRAADAGPMLVGLGLAILAYFAGRALVPHVIMVAHAAVATVVLTVVLSPAVLSGAAGAPPLDYQNANSALFVQLAALAALGALASTSLYMRIAGLVAAIGLVALAGVPGSTAGRVTGVALLLAVAVSISRPPRRLAGFAVGAIALVFAATAFTVWLGLGGDVARSGNALVNFSLDQLSSRRSALWHDALVLAAGQPIRGVGAGRFPIESPTAQLFTDTGAAHSLLLQVAAEIGIGGATALLALICWVLWRMRVGGRMDDASSPTRSQRLIGLVAATGLTVHASIDYVLSFPLVIVAGAIVAGLSTSPAEPTDRELLTRRSKPLRESRR